MADRVGGQARNRPKVPNRDDLFLSNDNSMVSMFRLMPGRGGREAKIVKGPVRSNSKQAKQRMCCAGFRWRAESATCPRCAACPRPHPASV